GRARRPARPGGARWAACYTAPMEPLRPDPAPAATPAELRAEAVRVAATLRDAGHLAYFAGGCVRDRLLGLEPKDYDIATSARPEQVQALFPHTVGVGASFGVVLVVRGPLQFEVA